MDLTNCSAAVRHFVETHPDWREFAAELNALFDAHYYLSQLGKQIVTEQNALNHYVDKGWKRDFDPHPLFDTSYYLETNAEVAKTGKPPLLHFIASGARDGRDPHPLFFSLHVLSNHADVIKANSNALVGYLSIPPSNRKSPCPFFSFEYYRAISPEVDWSRVDPLIHYIRIGAGDGRWPHPVFDVEYYAAFQMTPAEQKASSPFAHFCRSPEPRRKPIALFSAKQYLELYPDVKERNLCPVTHFLQYGVFDFLQDNDFADRRSPSRMRSNSYIMDTLDHLSFADRPPLWEYYRAQLHKRTRILFIGHEATRTGAVGILFNIVKGFSKTGDVDAITILDTGGPLADDFAQHSHCYVMKNNRLRLWRGQVAASDFGDELKEILELLADNPPVLAICNSLETRLYAPFFRKLGIPVVCLVHEIPDFYPVDEIQLVADFADRIVFSARFCADLMARKCALPSAQVRIIPQGLLRENFGSVWRKDRATVFRDLDITDDDIVVTGCGTSDGRKGFDLFVSIARIVTKRNKTGKRIKFIWIGGAKNWHRRNGAPFDSTSYWASWELEWNRLEDIVQVISEVPDTEPYLVNSDIFLLCSRLDPFPCVVHEAMACNLPVLCFENTGGASEAIGTEAGIVLPYEDIDAAADAILTLVSDNSRRHSMGAHGRQRVASQYRFADYVDKLKEVAVEVAQIEPVRLLAKQQKSRANPKVFFTSPAWNISGVNTFTESLIGYLNQNGFDAEVVFTLGRYGAPRTKGEFNVEYGSEPLPGCKYRWLQPKSRSQNDRKEALRALLIENSPCILVPNYDHDISDIVIDLPPSVGVVGIAHSDSDEYYAQCENHGGYWSRVVAVSDLIARKVTALDPLLAPKIETIRYGVEPPDRKVVARAIQKRRNEASPIRLFYAGRFESAQKRIFDYCDLTKVLSKTDLDYHLTMVGDGSEFSDVSSKLATEISAGRVTLTGRLSHEETTNLMLDAHVLLLFSDFEGFPLVVIEGMQRGCIPLVYNMESGIPELIDNGHNGFIVKKRDFHAITEILRKISADTHLRTNLMSAAAATSDRLRLTQKEMGNRYVALMTEVISEISDDSDLRTADIKDEAITRPNVVGAQYENIEIVFSDRDGT